MNILNNYVDVIVKAAKDGTIIPLAFTLNDEMVKIARFIYISNQTEYYEEMGLTGKIWKVLSKDGTRYDLLLIDDKWMVAYGRG